jgi:hypothetical protein
LQHDQESELIYLIQKNSLKFMVLDSQTNNYKFKVLIGFYYFENHK